MYSAKGRKNWTIQSFYLTNYNICLAALNIDTIIFVFTPIKIASSNCKLSSQGRRKYSKSGGIMQLGGTMTNKKG